MRCSECAKFKTSDCLANPGGADWDMAENYSCFVSKAERPVSPPPVNRTPAYPGQPPISNKAYYLAQEETSWAWWLMPIFFEWLGGLVGYFALRDKDYPKAKALLITGILISLVPLLFWLFTFSCVMMAGF